MKKILLFLFILLAGKSFVFAQWTATTPPFGSVSSTFGVRSMSVPSPQVVWVIGRGATSSTPNNYWARTTNGGQTWTTGTTGSSTSNFVISSISAVNADTAWVTLANSSGGQLLRTTNRGTTWQNMLPSAFSGGYPNFVHFFNSQHGIAGGDPNGFNPDWEIYTTANGGQTWTPVPPASIPAPLVNETGTSNQYFAQGNHIWFLTKKSRIFHSANRGQTFTASNTGLPMLHHLAYQDPMKGYANVLNQVKKTIDGGVTWTSVTPTGPMHYYWYEYVPGTNVMVSTGLNVNNNDVGSSYSLDGGQTWTAIESAIKGSMIRFPNNTTGYLSSIDGGSLSFHKWTGPAFQLVSATKDEKQVQDLKIWPNPGSGSYKLVLPRPLKTVKVEFHDNMGRIVNQQQLTLESPEIQIEIPDLRRGLYFLLIQAPDGSNFKARLIKQ